MGASSVLATFAILPTNLDKNPCISCFSEPLSSLYSPVHADVWNSIKSSPSSSLSW
uniref:hypothetical protein n=1 Tax=Okeania sp. SIO2F4 TaxID=2607790 RepID=UPI0025F492C2|nr:hypothetical protein [Okeania sp. SIO2F4]